MTSAITPLMEVKTFTYEWAIEDFSKSCPKRLSPDRKMYVNTYISSPYFPPIVDDENNNQWHIKAFTRGKSEQTSSLVSLTVTQKCNVSIYSTRFLILNDKKEKIPITDIKTINDKSIEFIISRDMIFAEENGLLVEDELILICELSFAIKNVGKCLPKAIKIPQRKSKLCDDFKKLFENKQYSDLKIIAKGQEFKVHKAVLTARSEVFAAMFGHEMDEQKSNQVNITDIEPEVIEAMLHYIYTDKVPKLNTLVYDLFFAADKYELQHLKKICTEFLISQISVETVAHTLLLADRHHHNELKKYTFEFILNNVKDVVQTQCWKDLIKECPLLITEAFCPIAVGPEGN